MSVHVCTQLYTHVYTTVYTRVHKCALSETIAQAHLFTASTFLLQTSGDLGREVGYLHLPLAPSREDNPPERGFSGLFDALEYKKPGHTLQIVCHSFQDILCMGSLKPSVTTSPS